MGNTMDTQMGTPVGTATTMEPRAEPLDWAEALEMYPDTDRVEVARRDGPGEPKHQGTLLVREFERGGEFQDESLPDVVAARYGGGSYRLTLRAQRAFRKTVPLEIDGPPIRRSALAAARAAEPATPVTSQDGDRLDRLERMLESVLTRQAPVQAAAPAFDPNTVFNMAMQMANAMKPPEGDSIERTFRLLEMADRMRERVAGGEAPKPSGLGDVIEGLKPIGEAMLKEADTRAAQAAAARTAPAPVRPWVKFAAPHVGNIKAAMGMRISPVQVAKVAHQQIVDGGVEHVYLDILADVSAGGFVDRACGYFPRIPAETQAYARRVFEAVEHLVRADLATANAQGEMTDGVEAHGGSAGNGDASPDGGDS